MDCRDTKELLSDLLDVRRGERPSAEDSPLGDLRVLSQVEEHLSSCSACRSELEALSEIGNAFSDFCVAEKSAQEFSDYGTVIRERMSGKRAPLVDRNSNPGKYRLGGYWWPIAAGSVAAMMAFAVFLFPTLVSMNVPRNANLNVAAPPPSIDRHVDQEGISGANAHGRKPAIDVRDSMTGASPTVRINQTGAKNSNAPLTFLLHPESGPASPVTINNFFPNSDSEGWLIEAQKLNRKILNSGHVTLSEKANAPNSSKVLFGANILSSPVTGGERSTSAEGLFVASILPNSPAFRVGLKRGDYITRISLPKERPLSSFESSNWIDTLIFIKIIKRLGRGRIVRIEYQRPQGDDMILRSGMAELGLYK